MLWGFTSVQVILRKLAIGPAGTIPISISLSLSPGRQGMDSSSLFSGTCLLHSCVLLSPTRLW